MFSHTPWYPLALAFIAVGAFGMMSQITISNTLLQTTADPAMRGRVISFYGLAYTGTLPLGSLLVGVVSRHIGVQNTVLAQGGWPWAWARCTGTPCTSSPPCTLTCPPQLHAGPGVVELAVP